MERVTFIPIDTGLLARVENKPVISFFHQRQRGRTLAIGVLASISCLLRGGCRLFSIAAARPGTEQCHTTESGETVTTAIASKRRLVVLVVPTAYLTAELFSAVQAACLGGSSHVIKTDDVPIAIPAGAATSIISPPTDLPFNLAAALASLSNLPCEDATAPVAQRFAKLGYAWAAPDLTDAMVFHRARIASVRRFDRVIPMLFASVPDRITSCVAQLSLLLPGLWRGHWDYALLHGGPEVDSAAAAAAAADVCPLLRVVLSYWRWGLRVSITGPHAEASACNTLWLHSSKAATVETPGQVSWRAAHVMSTTQQYALLQLPDQEVFAARVRVALQQLVASMPYLCLFSDVDAWLPYVSAILACMFDAKVDAQTTLLAYLLYLQVPDKRSEQMNRELLGLMLWNYNVVRTADTFVIDTSVSPISSHLRTALVAAGKLDTTANTIRISMRDLCANPDTVVTCEQYKMLVNFASVATANEAGCGMSATHDWIMVPQTHLMHDDALPGGTAHVMFVNAFPPDWVRVGAMSYTQHARTPLDVATTLSDTDISTVVTSNFNEQYNEERKRRKKGKGVFRQCVWVHQQQKLLRPKRARPDTRDERQVCRLCSERLVECSDVLAVAVRLWVLTGGVIFVRSLSAWSFHTLGARVGIPTAVQALVQPPLNAPISC